jgi:hypothetical protein
MDVNDSVTYSSPVAPLPEVFRKQLNDTQLSNNIGLLKTIENGDCFFHAIHLGLVSICNDKDWVHLTTKDLRNIVAASVFSVCTDVGVHRLLHRLQELLLVADEQTRAENRHMAPLVVEQKTSFVVNDLIHVYRRMRQRDVYWGDPYAMFILSKYLSVCLVILSKTTSHPAGMSCQYTTNQPPENNDPCIVLLHEADHFRLCAHRFDDPVTTSTMASQEPFRWYGFFYWEEIPVPWRQIAVSLFDDVS